MPPKMTPVRELDAQMTFLDAPASESADPAEEDSISRYHHVPNIVWVKALAAACPGDHAQCINKTTGKIKHYFRSPIPGMAVDDLMALCRDDALFPPGTPKNVAHRFRILMGWPRARVLAAHSLRTLR